MKNKITLLIISIIITISPIYSKEYTTHKLSNGQTVIVKEVHDNPIVTIDTWIKTGSINENDANNGVAHFLEHMFFKGTKKYPIGKFDRILESRGGITNAATSKDYTHYYIIIPSKDFDLALDLHSDMLLNPIIPRNELEMERKVILEEISRGEDNPDNVLFKTINKAFYETHPYKRDIIGTKKIIETIPREELQKFYDTWYNPDNMITVVVGDIETEEVINKIEKSFKKITQQKTPKIKYKKDVIKTKIPPIQKNIDTETGYLLIAFRGVSHKDKRESAALDLLATMLGSGKSSRLYQSIQEQKHLTTSIYSSHYSIKDDSIFYIKAKFPPNNQKEVETAIWSELKNFTKYRVSQSELDKAKNMIKRNIFYSRESISNIANELGYIALLYNNPAYYNKYLKDIEKITPHDIEKVANKYLDKDKAVISYILPKGQDIIPVKKIKATKNKNIQNSNSLSDRILNKNYPNSNAKLISQDKNTKKYLLENGLTLIITDNKSNDIISMSLFSKGGYFQENDIQKRGIGNILAEMLLKETKNYSFNELNNILDENAITIIPQASPDYFLTTIKITKNEFLLSLKLFDEIINNQNFKKEVLDKVKENKAQQIKTSRDIPSSVAFDEMKYLLWGDLPYQNSNKYIETKYKNIEISDLIKYYNQLYFPKNTIISVNGNVDDQTLINYFSDVFKNKSSKIYNLKEYTSAFNITKKNKESIIKKDSKQKWIVIAYKTPAIDNMKEWATLKVIDSLLGTGMSSRLFINLRDKQGLAYTVASTYQTNMLQGIFSIYIGTNPQNIKLAEEGIIKEINKLKRNFVSSTELKQAKDKILGNYLISNETNTEKAQVKGLFELYEKGYDFEKNFEKYINEVTEQDIIEISNKYFSEGMTKIIIK